MNNQKKNKITKNYCCMKCGNLICSRTAFYGGGCCRFCGRLPYKKHFGYYCVDCGIKIDKFGRSSRCVHCKSKGKINSNYKGKIKKFRSTWEANFAKWCDLYGIKWEYEPKIFDLGYTSYTPDFYLPEFDKFVEIKGRWYEKSKQKMKKFFKIYSNINLIILCKKELNQLSILNY